MRNHLNCSVVVPLFNEEENVLPLYVRLTEVMAAVGEPYEIVFVDDGSWDSTFRVLTEIQANDERVHVIRLRRNFGQTAALNAGFDFAGGQTIIALDGDLQYDPAEIPLLLKKLREGYDIVSGWRVERQDTLFTRRLPSRVANWLMRKLSGVPLHDFGSTFKAYRREVVQNLPLYAELHRFIPALAGLQGASVAEQPVHVYPRAAGKSNYGISRTFPVVLDLLKVKFLLDYSMKPLQLFGLFALGLLGIGALIDFFLLWEKLIRHEHLMVVHAPLMLLGIMFLIGGVQFLSLGLIGELVTRSYYSQKPSYAIRDIRSHRREFKQSRKAA